MAFIWDLVLQIERILNIGSLMWPLNDLQAPILAPWYYPIKNGFIIFSITLQQVQEKSSSRALSLFPPDDGHLETYGRGSHPRGVGLEIGQNWSLNHTIKDYRSEQRMCFIFFFFLWKAWYWFYSLIFAKMETLFHWSANWNTISLSCVLLICFF